MSIAPWKKGGGGAANINLCVVCIKKERKHKIEESSQNVRDKEKGG